MLRGRFGPARTDEEWCERGLLARIHRLTLGRLRREIEPVAGRRLHALPLPLAARAAGHAAARPRGRARRSIAQLQGLELPARAWERTCCRRASRATTRPISSSSASPATSRGAASRAGAPPDDDERAGGPRRRRARRTAPAPIAFVLREDLPWLLAPPTATPDDSARDAARARPHLARARRVVPRRHRARDAACCRRRSRRRSGTLVARGLVTGDGIAGLRALIDKPDDGRAATRRLRMLRGGRGAARCRRAAGRCCATRARRREPTDAERVARPVAARATASCCASSSRARRGCRRGASSCRALRTLEARGEVRGGRFVAGMVGEQFALPEAVEALRAVRRRPGGAETRDRRRRRSAQPGRHPRARARASRRRSRDVIAFARRRRRRGGRARRGARAGSGSARRGRSRVTRRRARSGARSPAPVERALVDAGPLQRAIADP